MTAPARPGPPDPVLCYIDAPWAWFTTQALDKQWGDDWGDAPYESNAGDPYGWRDYMGEPGYELVRLAFDGNYTTPDSHRGVGPNGSPSVETINAGAAPWLAEAWYGLRRPPAWTVPAGITLAEFLRVAPDYGLSIWLPAPSPERG